MDFFGMGPLEILLILVLALIIFGPEKLPEIGRTLGKMVRTLKKASSELTLQITREIEEKENRHPPGQTQKSSTQPEESTEPQRQDRASAKK